MPLLVILFDTSGLRNTCLNQIQPKPILQHLHLFLTMKPQHLSCVASDANKGIHRERNRKTPAIPVQRDGAALIKI